MQQQVIGRADDFLAAEAVVDAAICCFEMETGSRPSRSSRDDLVQTVFCFPELTKRLFETDSLRVLLARSP